MAAASDSNYSGSLLVLLQQIGKMKALPDADLPFVTQIETLVLQEIRSPEHQMAKAGLIPPAGMNAGGPGGPAGPPMMPPGAGLPPGMGLPPGAGPPPSFAGAGVPGGNVQTAPPQNPDELRRILMAHG